MKKKNILIIVIIVLFIILLIPIHINILKDGGTVEYKALTYKISKVHRYSETEHEDGIIVEILGKEIFNNTIVKHIERNVAVLFESIDKKNIKKSNGESLDNIQNTEYSSFVGTVLEETTKYMIVEPNKDEEERKSSDKIQINYGTDHIDYLYGIGRKVVIYYTGGIMESYPAQINTDNISINGYEDFKIEVKPSNKIETKKILNNKDLSADNQDYNLYFYGLDEVNVAVDNKTMPLENALKSGKMTIQGIIQKANKDISNEISYKDGGSIEYHYEDYTIIKCHTLDGNRDVYIGTKDLKLTDVI